MSEPDPKQAEKSGEALKGTSPELDGQSEKNVEENPTDGLWDDDWHPDFSI